MIADRTDLDTQRPDLSRRLRTTHRNLDESLEVLVWDDTTGSDLELWDVPTATFLYTVRVEPRPGPDEARETAQSMMYEQRPYLVGHLADDQGLDRIAALLRRPDWSGADDMLVIAELVRATGRCTDTPGDPEHWDL